MNSVSTNLMEIVERLDSTLSTPTREQCDLIRMLREQIAKNGRFYEVTALTVSLMREHGYDVSEDDGQLMEALANKVEVDPDILWNGVDTWADYYGIKRLED